MTNQANGTFDVNIVPQAPDDATGGPFARMLFDKQFHGDLDGASKGQMLASGSGTGGSAAYVALELFTGTLNGRRGSFVLQHNGTMTKEGSTLNVIVVPDSATDQLAGLTGKLTIIVTGGKHFYEFEYTLRP